MTLLERYAVAAQEDRCAPRTKTFIPARIRPSGAHAFDTIVVDLSLSGFACQAVTGAPPGTLCWLTLPGLGSQQAQIVWNNGAAIGCAFSTLMNQAVLEAMFSKYA